MAFMPQQEQKTTNLVVLPDKAKPGQAAPLHRDDDNKDREKGFLGLGFDNLHNAAMISQTMQAFQNNPEVMKMMNLMVPLLVLQQLQHWNDSKKDGQSVDDQMKLISQMLYDTDERREQDRQKREAFISFVDRLVENDGFVDRPRDWSKLSKKEIAEHQERLQERGYMCSSDAKGVAGWATKRAAFLADVYGKDQNPPLQEAEIEARTREVQKALQKIKGPDGKPLYSGAIDGKPGELTDKALSSYIRMNKKDPNFKASVQANGTMYDKIIADGNKAPSPALNSKYAVNNAPKPGM